MGRTGKVLVVSGSLLAMVAAAPWLIPAGAWLPQVESAASLRLGATVKLTGLQFAVLPLPHLNLQGLDIGEGAVHADSISVYPRLLSMLSAAKELRLIALNDVSISATGVDLLAGVAARPSQGKDSIIIEEVHIRNLRAALPAGALPALDLELQMQTEGVSPVKSARLTTLDRKAGLVLTPDGKEWTMAFEATEWRLPLGPPLLFGRLHAQGRLTPDKLSISEIEGALYDGSVSGKAELTWQKTWRLRGDAKLTGLNVIPLTQALGAKPSLSGKLDADGMFSSQATKPAALTDALRADFGFEVRSGALLGFDLASAAQSAFKTGGAVGNTQFDQFTGRLLVQGNAFKLQHLRVASGVLKAEGNVDVSGSRQLSGRIDTEVKGTAGLVGVPVAVAGTLDKPVLTPTSGSVAGAVVGTVLLPGVGTTIGSSVGDKIGRMFGK